MLADRSQPSWLTCSVFFFFYAFMLSIALLEINTCIIHEWYLHDAVPVVTSRNLEEREEGHAEVFKGGVAAHSLAGVVGVTHCEVT